MSQTRQRKAKLTSSGDVGPSSKELLSTESVQHTVSPKTELISTELEHNIVDGSNTLKPYTMYTLTIIGVFVMILLGYTHAFYMKTLHENNMWFSNIKEVEREISFRTESGLYYSYYKQMINAESINQGLYELMNDNTTEHLRTINILERFNIYQEVFLSVLYRLTPVKNLVEPIIFYIDSVFALHAVLVCSLYLTSWVLSGSWLTGLLAALFYIFNKTDTTRVAHVIPLRESFSLPFLWLQIFGVTYYFKSTILPKTEKFCLFIIGTSTFLFSICWQFNQFVLLLQAFALFGVWTLQLVPPYKIKAIYAIHVVSLLAVCLLQFFNKMILTSLLMSFIPAALAVMHLTDYWRSSNIILNGLKLVFQIVSVFLMMALINYSLKIIIRQDADEHIFKFLLAKFGIAKTQDFDATLYLCNGAFEFLTPDTFERLSRNLVFPIYVVSEIVLLGILAITVWKHWSSGQSSNSLLNGRPELAYHAVQSVFFGLIGLMTLRMKYLWTPHMCILASFSIGDSQLWANMLEKIRIKQNMVVQTTKHAVVLCVIGVLLSRCMPGIYKELEVLREFYDPNTVELMEWINRSTPQKAAFTGSMQLLAGVKLCTGRALSNHPHYEDIVLRKRTKELYQIYGRKPAKEVYAILKKYDVSYIILEDSMCMIPSNGCRIPDLIDVVNGEVPGHGRKEPGLVVSNSPRFCDEIRYMKTEYAKYFQSVFTNKTFRVYLLL